MEDVIEEKIYNSIKDYCEINNLDIKKYINQKLKSALMLDKYGSSPFSREDESNESTMNQEDIPFVVKSQEKTDWASKVGELKPIEPMLPDDDFITEKAKKPKKPVKKDAKQEKETKSSDDGKIMVNKRALK